MYMYNETLDKFLKCMWRAPYTLKKQKLMLQDKVFEGPSKKYKKQTRITYDPLLVPLKDICV